MDKCYFEITKKIGLQTKNRIVILGLLYGLILVLFKNLLSKVAL